MSVKNEKNFLNELVNDAATGIIVTATKIRLKLCNLISKTISKSYVYDFLKRNKWRKVAPRPQNPKSSKDVRDDFKKNLIKIKEMSVDYDRFFNEKNSVELDIRNLILNKVRLFQ